MAKAISPSYQESPTSTPNTSPNATYSGSTTPLNERQRQILSSVKGRELTVTRRDSASNDVSKREPQHSKLVPFARGLQKRRHDRIPPSRTLSPVVGAMPYHRPHIPEFVFREAIPSLILPQDISTWVTMYFTSPMAYHCYNYSEGMWLDVVHNRPIQRTTLMHKAKLLRMVNEYIDNFEDADLELLIMGMTTIFKVSTDDGSTFLSGPELFTPHADPDDLGRILKRMETVVLHANALNRLLDERGPDTPFEHFPGIEDSMPLVDVIISSAHACKPRYQTTTAQMLSRCPNRLTPFPALPSPYSEGLGFLTSVPGSLPLQALNAYRNLATLDRLCSTTTVPNAAHFKYFAIDPRVNAVQHQLLSMPHWDVLSADDQEDSSRVIYESCRIACILYSNSVIHPVPTTVGSWLPCLLGDLKYLLLRSGVPKKDHDAVPLAIWVSFVGCMCSYGMKNEWGFFLRCLREIVRVAGLVGDWEGVRRVLERFLWSESACARGARVVWREIMKGVD
ncbi:hypothetical protein M409DRAFT_24868 [Zasmidium cellare ATCC 36951]|uniref:Tachykinin family protein n=1 Tax=Zasmidium cellare ATCC 36951 TaxID=1080233 RepID=A0A6A6CCP5_ZASCE|nr:uncharacterized protein M409DRAFT_24868 [Zasmidium cellare ATCC 36951]KAF2164967.1 hypothetical protein M409DRAFT_24868 [Zasmidium cellare ATCC 36951]